MQELSAAAAAAAVAASPAATTAAEGYASPLFSKATAAAAAAAAAPPTPLEQRQWQRLAQRSVRLAVTAFKDAGTKFADATAAGTAVATQLNNSILMERYMPQTELPEVLKGVDGLQNAAVAKLQRQQQEQLGQLEQQVEVMETLLQNLDATISDMNSNLSAPWQSALPVFHALTLPESRDMLLQIMDMYKQELESKQILLESYTQITQPSSSSSSSREGLGGSKTFGGKAAGSVDDLRIVLTAAVTTWMVRPHIEEEAVEQLLQVLTDEMTGF